MSRRPLVAANWKLNGSRELCEQFASGLGSIDTADVWIFPTALHLMLLSELLDGQRVGIGAQNVADSQSGAFTGEIAATMVAALGGISALVGHSERRSLYGETDKLVASKFKAIQSAGLVPVLCVGESLEKREKGMAFEAVQSQLQAVEAAWDQPDFKHEVIAYEPVWAIGSGQAATPDQVQSMHEFIRSHIQSKQSGGANTRILYGGSVKVENVSELSALKDVDGFLVGGASLQVDSFRQICESVNA